MYLLFSLRVPNATLYVSGLVLVPVPVGCSSKLVTHEGVVRFISSANLQRFADSTYIGRSIAYFAMPVVVTITRSKSFFSFTLLRWTPLPLYPSVTVTHTIDTNRVRRMKSSWSRDRVASEKKLTTELFKSRQRHARISSYHHINQGAFVN